MRAGRTEDTGKRYSDKKESGSSGTVKKRRVIPVVLLVLVFALIGSAAGYYATHCGIEGKRAGWIVRPSGIYHCGENGVKDTGITKVGKYYYYFAEDAGKHQGRLFNRGYVRVNGRPYYFGKLGRAAKKGWIEDKYYCKGRGRLTVGWAAIDDKAYYFYRSGEVPDTPAGLQAKDYTPANGIHIPEQGFIDGEEGKAYAYAIETLDDIGWNLRSAYRFAANFSYSGREERYDFLIHKAAIAGFENHTGNCLVWNGVFCTLARMLGYDCDMIWGFINSKNKEYVHSWCEITEDGQVYVYDPRQNNGKNFKGFRVIYGQKGTYKYDTDRKTYLEW